jgi:hypothetical protein
MRTIELAITGMTIIMVHLKSSMSSARHMKMEWNATFPTRPASWIIAFRFHTTSQATQPATSLAQDVTSPIGHDNIRTVNFAMSPVDLKALEPTERSKEIAVSRDEKSVTHHSIEIKTYNAHV